MADKNKVKILRHKRSLINPIGKATAVVLDEATALVEWTCTKCAHKWKQQILIGPKTNGRTRETRKPIKKLCKPLDPAMLRKMVPYWNQGGGATGHCPACTKRARDAAHPFPK